MAINHTHYNPLPHIKMSDLSRLEAFADDNFKGAHMVLFCFDRVENFVGKGENAVNFLLFPQCFQKAFSLGASKVQIVW